MYVHKAEMWFIPICYGLEFLFSCIQNRVGEVEAGYRTNT